MRREQLKIVRCAIYTRKSTDIGLEQEFNSLDAQRDAGEAFIASQRHEGWECIDTRYDDGGFTGGNLDRPAMRRLMEDIEAGKIDCVVVYKVDRLSRSLMDFSRLMETFDKHEVAFVSVTQQFNTASSMGRLILNVLLSFAQFEREMISERTRDKIAATRRKGKWCGGIPILGYTVEDTKLIVVPHEAQRVRQLFDLYLQTRSLIETAKEANKRAWRTKQWTTKKGTIRGDCEFNKNRIHQLLTNVTYLGKLTYKDEVHEGQHEAIVDTETFDRVARSLKRNGRTGMMQASTNFDGMLRGILRCAGCNRIMLHTSTGRGPKRYRYYVCGKADKQGYEACDSPSIPAGQIEDFVVKELRTIAADDELIRNIYDRTHEQEREKTTDQRKEMNSLRECIRNDYEELNHFATNKASLDHIATVQERITDNEQRYNLLKRSIDQHRDETISHAEIRDALHQFDDMWDAMSRKERCRLIELIIQTVNFDGVAGTIDIIFQTTGIKTLGQGFDLLESAK
ncbi:recombinase family protein [Novipirellula artificiosorum]|uniref:DNA-invertase hin n=1 Tax=Novipirellula artificiosorum TaxID=2528016 RepID=A0A5C6DQ08_9BACT|nr:recombinase family protein [Novipirellula artificiosorum]TWU39363.1 DNA-invertase hin [Novipirellula artificiosorum]